MRVAIRPLALLAMAALCLGGAAPQESAVSIDNFSFTPAEITVAPGTTVVWTNRDDIPHTVTSADTPRLFKSDPMDTDGHFAYRFDHAGRFAYFCSLHAHMQGVVIVR
jgi:plastocyanin